MIVTTLDLAAALIENGDATYNVDTYAVENLTEGYVVAQAGGVESYIAAAGQADIYAVSRWLNALPVEARLVGSWTAEDGTLYVDAVEVFEDEQAARVACFERNELAYFDVAAGVAVANDYYRA